jgi:hypothetical protein
MAVVVVADSTVAEAAMVVADIARRFGLLQ